jgi:hypothetical protein
MKTLVLFRTLARVFRGFAALIVAACSSFHRPVRVKEVAVLDVMFQVVLPNNKRNPELYSVIYK